MTTPAPQESETPQTDNLAAMHDEVQLHCETSGYKEMREHAGQLERDVTAYRNEHTAMSSELAALRAEVERHRAAEKPPITLLTFNTDCYVNGRFVAAGTSVDLRLESSNGIQEKS